MHNRFYDSVVLAFGLSVLVLLSNSLTLALDTVHTGSFTVFNFHSHNRVVVA